MRQLGQALVVVGLLLTIGACAAMSEIQTPSCRAALLVIDMQRAWVGSDALTADGAHVTSNVAGIVDSARAAGIPVIFVVDVSMRWRFGERQLSLVDPLEVLEEDQIVEKRRQNGFLETDLADLLRGMGATALLITGYASHECVRATVEGALEEGFEIIIVEDGHSGGVGGREATRQNWIWGRRGIRVASSAEIDFADPCAPVDSEE